jgi:hypothetical protein
VHFGGTVIDPEGADVAEDLLHRRVAGDAQAAQHLHAAVGHAVQRLRHRDLAMLDSDVPGVPGQHPGAPVDGQLGLLQIDLVVGQHEADAFVIDQRLAEGAPLAGISDGDVVGPLGRSPPAHAVGEARRRESDLSVLETQIHLAQHLRNRHPHVFQTDHRMTARHRSIDGVQRAIDVNARHIHVGQEHGRPAAGARHDGQARASAP